MAHRYRDSYLAADLTFTDDKITWECPQTGDTREVMMSWEQPIMEKMAEVAVSAGEHVLECGFGMGILSTAVQSRNPASHTIVECHPEIIVKLKAWAADKPTVTVIEGNWIDLLDDAETRYDTILMDTYVDDKLHSDFRYFCKNKIKDGGKVSWWNFSGGTEDEYMKFYWNNVTFTEVTGLSPEENTYYNRTNYFIPLKVINHTRGWGVLKGSDISFTALERTEVQNAMKETTVLTSETPGAELEEKAIINCTNMKCKGLITLNTDLISAAAHTPMIVKRSDVWTDVIMKDVIVGDILYTLDGEISVADISFDGSDNIHEITKVITDHNYFINGILLRKGGPNG